MRFTKLQLRQYLVATHHLDRRLQPEQMEEVAFAQLGCVQFDPLDRAGRSADLVLHARIRDFRPAMLADRLYRTRSLVDGWDKMMAIYPLADWRYFRRLRVYKETELRNTLSYRNSLHALAGEEVVLRHLRDHGPSSSAEIELGAVAPGNWGHSRQSAVVLDYLFHTGRVGVVGKTGVQKRYDLIERLVPAQVLEAPDPFGSDREWHRWVILRRMRGMGVLWNRTGLIWQGLGPELTNRAYREALLRELVAAGLAVRIAVEEIAEPLYVCARGLARLEECARTVTTKSAPSDEVRFLAPLDNLLWDRDLVEAVFGFRYRWEVYVPAAKREFGYYVLPILWGNALIGRIEPVADRKRRRLTVQNLWLESAKRLTARQARALRLELDRLAAFLGMDTVEFTGRAAGAV